MPRHVLDVASAQERPLHGSHEREALVGAREGVDADDPAAARPRRLALGGCALLAVVAVCGAVAPSGLATVASAAGALGSSTSHLFSPGAVTAAAHAAGDYQTPGRASFALRSAIREAGPGDWRTQAHRTQGAARLAVTYGAGISTTLGVNSSRSDVLLDTGEDDVGQVPVAVSGPLVTDEVEGYLPASGEGALEDSPASKDSDGCGALREFYLYRAQSDAEYPEENVNAADLPGVLWYLHNEVMTQCPRKYAITRVLRLKVAMVPTAALQEQGRLFSPYVAFDSGKCTVPGCEQSWAETGFSLGCQVSGGGAMGGYDGQWFSLPGPCPQEERGGKSADCNASWPGGRCDDVTGDPTCTYSVSDAGEVRLDELTGIRDYGEYCSAGGLEYDRAADTGVNLTFWSGIDDRNLCQRRVLKLSDAFRLKYGHQFPTLPRASCAADC